MRSNPKKPRVAVLDTGNVTPVAAPGSRRSVFYTGVGAAILAVGLVPSAVGQVPLVAPSVVDSNLAVRKVAFGLDQPTSMAFIGTNDILVLEKATGRVKRVINNVVQGAPALDCLRFAMAAAAADASTLRPGFVDISQVQSLAAQVELRFLPQSA